MTTVMTAAKSMLVAWLLVLGMAVAYAAEPPAPAAAAATSSGTLDERIQNLKGEVLKLNRDLFILEEELLFPASTQIVVFVSQDVGLLFSLDSVELKINDKTVSQYLYTAREQDALKRGGVQQLYIGNVPTGKIELVAFFNGKGPHDRAYTRGSQFVVEKSSAPKYVELKISDNASKQQPEFVIKEW